MTRNEKIINIPNQQPGKKIRLRHILEVFSEWSRGDVDAAESTVHSFNAANMKNLREIVSWNLKKISGRHSDVYVQTNEVDPAAYDQKIGMTQRSDGGDTFVSTEVVRDSKGGLGLISLAFTTKLREEVRIILGEPEKPAENNLSQFPATAQPQEEEKIAA